MVEDEFKFKFDNYSWHLGVRGKHDWYKWKVFMDEPPDILDKVNSIEYKLHETFANPIRIVNDRKSRFALSSVGWGSFWIHITVYLKDGREIPTKYWLDLNRPRPAGETTMRDIETQVAKVAIQKKSVLIINDDKEYLFSWDNIPGNDNRRLIEFLTQKFSIDWVKTANIEKIDDGRTIRLTEKNNFLSLILNNEKTKVNLEINDSRTDEFIVKIKNDKLNIYSRRNQSMLVFKLAFGNMGYNVRIENSEETLYSTWSNYEIIVWSCGDYYSAIDDDKSRQMLIDYVAIGGRLILESGNVAARNKEEGVTTMAHRFRQQVLHITGDWAYHDVGDLILKTKHPVATTPNKLPETIGFTPTNPGDISGDANAVRILPDATGIYGWSHVAYGGKLVGESITSISYGLIAYESESENGGRIVYFAFDIDDIDSPDIRQKLIQNSANWLTRASKHSMQ